MDGLENRVRETIRQYHMLEPGDRVVAAVSGGADSVCLLALLCQFRRQMGLKLKALHVHHGLRGQEADRDADFVRALCAELDVPCHIIKVDVRGFGAAKGMSEEEAGRYLRYEALETEAQMWEEEDAGALPPCRNVKIAVAHHSGDQVETILHNLFRGSGLSGMKGISYIRGRIIRPLLDVDRESIVGWLSDRNLTYVQDSTNASGHYTRNRIRNRILPEIQRDVNQGAPGNILRMGKLAAQADEYLKSQAAAWIRAHVERKEGAYIPAGPFLKEPEILRSYVVMVLLKELGGSARDIGLVHVNQVMELADRAVGRQADLPYGLMARKEYDGIRIRRGDTAPEGGGEGLPAVDIEVFSLKKGAEFPKNMYTKWLDCDKIKDTPVVRTRRPGDYIILADGSHKALNRFMIDEKIPRQTRDSIPLLADGSHVMWIIGYRISEYYKIGPDTIRVLQAEVHPSEKRKV